MKAPEGIVGCGYSWLSYPMLLLAVAVICKACMLLDASNFSPYYSRCLKWSPLPCFALLICWAAELRAQWSSMRRLKACSWAALLCAVNLLSWMHAAVAPACRCICMLRQSLVGQCRFKFFSSRAPAELAVPVCDGCGGLRAVCRPAHLHPESPLPQIQETHMNQQVIGAQELIVSIYTHIFTVLLSITCVMILFSSRSMRTIYIRYT